MLRWKLALALTAVVVIAAVVWFVHREPAGSPEIAAAGNANVPPHGAVAPGPVELTPATGIQLGPTPVRAFNASRVAPPVPDSARSPLADHLNDPAGSAQDDVRIVGNIVENYLSVFHEIPVGTNAEITAALAGDNSRGLAPLPADHPAITARGELVDRWGTRFFFHQVSRTSMEVRSAGPDRRHFTDDDVIWPEHRETNPAALARLAR